MDLFTSRRLRRRGSTLSKGFSRRSRAERSDAAFSNPDLKEAISRYIKANNKMSKPFKWTASAPTIFKKIAQIPEPFE